MQKEFISVILSLLMLFPTACKPSDDSSPGGSSPESAVPPTTGIAQTGQTISVPAEYVAPASQQGTVAELSYSSKDYVRDGSDTVKTTYVYLPYGYDEADTETRYNILYLMHGWGGHAGEYFEFTPTKNMFDNLIENGDIPPVIIVSATFYNENSSRDFSGSINELRNFHLDFENHLMAAVEGK